MFYERRNVHNILGFKGELSFQAMITHVITDILGKEL